MHLCILITTCSYLYKRLRVRYHLNEHPVGVFLRVEDLTIEELHSLANLLSDPTHKPMEETSFRKEIFTKCMYRVKYNVYPLSATNEKCILSPTLKCKAYLNMRNYYMKGPYSYICT